MSQELFELIFVFLTGFLLASGLDYYLFQASRRKAIANFVKRHQKELKDAEQAYQVSQALQQKDKA